MPSATATMEPIVQPPASGTTSTKGGGVMRSSAIFSGLTLVSRFAGFARDLVITAALGASAGPAADAYNTALSFPNLFRRIFAEGAFAAAFVPAYAKTLQSEGPEAADKVATDALAAIAAITVVLTIIAQISMPWLMTIINVIADQTKLIAFNAALEAASAGESGRRFSVVAAEIRRLADSVTDSTGEIESKVSEIQDSISRLVITSEKGASGIIEGMEATTHTADRLSELVDAASKTASAAQQISLSTQQQKTAVSQVVIALREIVGATHHTAQSMSQLSDVSRNMADLSSDMDDQVGRFRLNNAG